MASLPQEGIYPGGVLPSSTPVQAKDRGRAGVGMYKAVVEFWPEWLFTALVLVGGLLMMIMLLRS